METKPQPASVSDLQAHTGFWLRFVSNHVSQAFARKLSDSGVTTAEWVVLREMYGEISIAPSTVAERVGLTRGAVSKLVDRLLEKKLVSRAIAKEDRRFQQIALTSAGRRLIPKLAALADRNDTEFFAGLTREEHESLRASLRKLVRLNRLTSLPIE